MGIPVKANYTTKIIPITVDNGYYYKALCPFGATG